MYKYEIDRQDIKLVEVALIVIDDLKVPISKHIVFRYCKGKSRFGYIKVEGNQFCVYFNPYIINEKKKINTIIHELLHIISCDSYSNHKGEWAKWAKIVSNHSEYKITINDSYKLINYPTKTPTKKVYCPCCEQSFEVPDNQREYWCRKCNKPLFDNMPINKLSIRKSLEKLSEKRHFWSQRPTINTVPTIF